MLELSLSLDEPEYDEYPNKTGICNGDIYRASTSWFENSNGDYEYRVKFRHLKRKSCPGCKQCASIKECANEMSESIIFPLEPKHGSLWKLSITNVSTDWESGVVDDWDVELVEYQE